ncbi:hypothetical protein V8F33_014208, partial [Rhypophila sp. PSN 637]
TPKKRYKKPDISRDQRLQIQALHKYAGLTLHKYAGLTHVEIARRTPFSIDQVRHVLHNPATPQKKKQHHKALQLKTSERKRLAEWIQSGKNRYIPICRWQYFLPSPLKQHGQVALRRALQEIGGQVVVRPRRVPLTEETKQDRLQWAIRQLELRPRPVDWEFILFSDETWAKATLMRKQQAILLPGEDPRKIRGFAVKKRSKPEAWMFWGSFAGGERGPCFIWEKE